MSTPSDPISSSGVSDMIEVLREVRTFLTADKDLEEVQEAEEVVQMELEQRRAVVDQTKEDLRALSHTLSEARHRAARPPTHPSQEQHDHQISQMENDRISGGKQKNDEELLVGKREGELTRWKEELREQEGRRVEEEVEGLSKGVGEGVPLRLKTMSDMGFRLKTSETGKQVFLVSSSTTPDIHDLPLDPHPSMSERFLQVNRVWALAGEV